jgi:20S proteasome alpha/beta subunit
MVVLTDSMLTENWQDARGVRHSKQRTDPAQKLFRLDDHTVCAFAGFASAATPPLPDFLNSVSAIVGRYRDELTHITAPVSFAQKLQMLEGVFAYYLTGTANIRNSGAEQDYLFELLLAGYDLDGTPKVGRLILGTAPDLAQRGQVWTPVTYEREVFPITPGTGEEL